MINNFLRKLHPYGGLHDSGSSSGGGGGGSSSSSTVSDREFNDAIAQDTANRNQTNYGSNYYSGGSSSQQADTAAAQARYEAQKAAEAQAAAKAAAEAKAAEEARIAAAAKAAEEARIAEEQRLAEEAFQAEFDAAIKQEQALEAAYGLDAFNITSSGIGDIAFEYIDPFTDTVQTLSSVDDFEGMLQTSIADENERQFQALMDQQAAAEAAAQAKAAEEAAASKAAAQAEREKAEAGLKDGTADPLAFLDAFNKAQVADLDETLDTIAAKEAPTYATENLTTTTGDIVQAAVPDFDAILGTTPPTYTNELGETYTTADIEALGTRSDQGEYLIGNVANRVELDDGSTGYLIGTGNNRVETDSGSGYSMGRVDDAAKGLTAEQSDYITPSPVPAAVDDYIGNPMDDIREFYDETITDPYELETSNPDLYTIGWEGAPRLSPTQLLDNAIASGEGITDYTFGDVETTDKFFDAYTRQNYNIPYNDAVMSQYGSGAEGYNNFVGAVEKAKENGTSWLGGDPDITIYQGKGPEDPNNGKIIAEDPVSFNGFAAAIGQALGNFVIGQIGGGIAGSLVSGLFGGFKAPLYSAFGTRAALQGYQPIQAAGYVDEFGEAYTVSSFFGRQEMAKVSEIEPQKFFESSGGSESATAAGEIVTAVNSGRAKGWRDYYNGSMSIEDIVTGAIIGNIISGADSFKGDLIKAAKEVIVDGQDPMVAVVRALGDDVTAALPEGYDKLTESAARMMVGENAIEVLGEIYGPEVGIEGPAGIAAVKGAVALDTGKSPEEALGISAYHYFKNGGTLPDFEIPSFLEGTDMDWGSIDLSFIEDGATAVVDFVKNLFPDDFSADFSFDIPDIPVGEWLADVGNTVTDVYGWMKDQMPEINVPNVDLAVDMPDLGIDLPDIDMDWDWLDWLQSDGAGGATQVASFDYVDPFAGTKRGVSNIDPVKYSQILLENARKV